MTEQPTDFLRVSYSSLNTFASCPRKFEFDKLYPKPSGREEFYAGAVGTALHEGYQEYMVSRNRDSATWKFMLAFPFELESYESNDYRSFNACLQTLEEMFNHIQMDEYELAQIKRPDGVDVPALEVPFELRFNNYRLPDGRGVAFIGYIDMITRSRMTGLYQTMDIKTSRMKINDATGKFRFDSQQVPYGIVVDHVAAESITEFEVLYLSAYIDLIQPEVSMYKFKKTQTDIQEWVANKVVQLDQMVSFIESDYFPRTDGGCMFFNRPCRYLEPCRTRDRKMLEAWFLEGREPHVDEPFEPWITATIDLGE